MCHVKHDHQNVLDPQDPINHDDPSLNQGEGQGQGIGQTALPLPLKGGVGGFGPRAGVTLELPGEA
jgi:hypothetical protein